jgi:hypothetical protein
MTAAIFLALAVVAQQPCLDGSCPAPTGVAKAYYLDAYGRTLYGWLEGTTIRYYETENPHLAQKPPQPQPTPEPEPEPEVRVEPEPPKQPVIKDLEDVENFGVDLEAVEQDQQPGTFETNDPGFRVDLLSESETYPEVEREVPLPIGPNALPASLSLAPYLPAALLVAATIVVLFIASRREP